jgi:hypothetical protein
MHNLVMRGPYPLAHSLPVVVDVRVTGCLHPLQRLQHGAYRIFYRSQAMRNPADVIREDRFMRVGDGRDRWRGLLLDRHVDQPDPKDGKEAFSKTPGRAWRFIALKPSYQENANTLSSGRLRMRNPDVHLHGHRATRSRAASFRTFNTNQRLPRTLITNNSWVPQHLWSIC